MRLPVEEIEEDLRSALAGGPAEAGGRRILLKAPTGSGKSTRVPEMMLEAGLEGRILVVEPRRMAARLLAGWVARQRGGAPGGEVGYAVRFDSRHGRDTRIIYLTDGVFQRWLQDDPGLDGVAAVVFDEFHERRLAVDVALGRCLELQDGRRPDLAIVVMSATLDTGGLADFLAPVTSLEAGGRTFPVEVDHRPERAAASRGGRPRETPSWERVSAVCREVVDDPDCGNVLCFLPGAYEIRRTVESLKRWVRGREVLPLFSGLSPAAQEEALRDDGRPRIIVATNVAETSLTIPGVRTVVDAGLARVAGFDPRRGIDTLWVRKISRAAAEQRAGRAGRTAPGRCLRLWSEADHARREAFETPEVHRVDLAETVLLLKAAGVGEVMDFRWLDAPRRENLGHAMELLHDLGAVDGDGAITPVGREMASLPLAPRWARMLLEAVGRDCVAEAAFVVAAAQGEGIFADRRKGGADFVQPGDRSDFQAEWRAYDSAVAMDFDPRRVAAIGVHGRHARELSRSLDRILRLARQRGWPLGEVDFERRAAAVGRVMLAGFSDRLAVRAGKATLACRLDGGRRGKIDDNSAAREADLFVAAEVTEVEGREMNVRLGRATVVEREWLVDLGEDALHETDGSAWDESRRCVVARRELRVRDLVIESRESDEGVNLDAAAELLAERVLAGELVLKRWDAKVEQWCARLGFLARTQPELGLPGWGDDDRAAAVAQVCHGATRYKQVKDAEVWPVLREWLSPAQRATLDAYAPERLDLANGRSVKVNYEAGSEPWIGLRVRDLFGVWETPRLVDYPVLVHVQAPNQRPWQMTRDLASFWAGGYAQMRRELAGRYPKHPWPEDPQAWFASAAKKG